jgi:hypothetical protein
VSRKQILVFVAALFTLVGAGFLFSFRRKAEVGEHLQEIELAELSEVRLVADPLRSERGFDIPVTEAADLEALVAALHDLEPSSRAIKSLEILDTLDLSLELDDGDQLILSVMRAAETGEVGVVSISKVLGPGESSIGVFESRALLAWTDEVGARLGARD